jgi:GT2 family glycosyltransferase
VSIVINHRGLDQTRVCVDSLLAMDYPNHSIVIVDSGSGSAEVDSLRGAFGDAAEIIDAQRNLGYGGGANLGLEWSRRVGATYAWVLNNDTVVDSHAVFELVKAMEREAGYGILSPQIDAPVGPESPFGIWYAGGTASLMRARAKHQVVPATSSAAVVPTGFITGCAMFLRLEAIAETGLFWEPLFLYWEDVDLCFRMSRAGWGLGVVPAARVVHFMHGSVESKVVRYYSARNAILVAHRHLHGRGAVAASFWVVAKVVRRGAMSLLKRDRPLPIAEARGLAAGLAVTLGLCRLDQQTDEP